MSNTDHPFQPGVEVAIRTVTHETWSIWETGKKVAKVHKNGNFTLQGDTQQWRPYGRSSLDNKHSATMTGDHYSRRLLYILSEVKDDIAKDRTTQARSRRFYTLRDRFLRLPFDQTTDAMLDAIEAALPPVPEEKA